MEPRTRSNPMMASDFVNSGKKWKERALAERLWVNVLSKSQNQITVLIPDLKSQV